MRIPHLILVSLLTVGLAACASSPGTSTAGNGQPGAQGQNENGGRYGSGGKNGYSQTETGQGQNAGNEQGQLASENPFENPDSKLSKLRIYFSFDSSNIQQQYKSILKAHAKYLDDHSRARVRLQGNTDERGTREYNIGLGRRRAKSVAQFLKRHGVPASHITTISYGEERPLVLGHNKKAWSKNRRVKIVYTNRGSSD